MAGYVGSGGYRTARLASCAAGHTSVAVAVSLLSAQLFEAVEEKIQRELELELVIASGADHRLLVVGDGDGQFGDVRVLALGFRERIDSRICRSVEQFSGETPHPPA